MFLLYLFIFLFGLIIGSFLNVVIFRLETGEQMARGRSHCRHCSHALEWYDLIPVISFLALSGKCRYCKKTLSIQYPIVEIATGILFILSLRATLGSEAISRLVQSGEIASSLPLLAMTMGNFIYYLFIASALVVIFVYDLRHYIIPDKIIYPAIIVSIIYLLFGVSDLIARHSFSGGGGFENLIIIFNPFLAAIIAGAFFFSIVFITKGQGMGGGDIKLAFLMGLALGWPKILAALFLAFTLGAICGIILIALKRKKFKSEIPFGPFLVLGTFIALFWGEKIISWYGGYIF